MSLHNLNRKELETLLNYLETYKLTYKSKLDIPKNTSYGLEVEFSKTPLNEVMTKLSDHPIFKDYDVKEDLSVSRISDIDFTTTLGGEVSTPIYHNTFQNWQDLQKLLKILKEMQALITDKCSSHIHIGSQIFANETKYAIRFIKLWVIFEPIILKYSINGSHARRNIFYYAQPISGLYSLKDLNNSDFDRYRLSKYKAVSYFQFSNTKAEQSYNTIEIRTPNGTLDPTIIQNNINFFVSLMNFTKSPLYNEKQIDALYEQLNDPKRDLFEPHLHHALILSDLIFSKLEYKLNFLKIYLKDTDPDVLMRKLPL